MIQFTAFTLVDITNTQQYNNHSKNNCMFLQQQNLNTLIQTISLRSQPLNTSINALLTQDIVNYEFGNCYTGLHTVWRLDFSIEHSNVFAYNNDKTSYLKNDSDGVAIYTNLEETVELKTKSFETISTKVVNLYINNNTDI